MENKTFIFQELNQSVEQLVNIHGYEKAVEMVKSLCKGNKEINNFNKLDLAVSFLIKKAAETFNINIPEIYKSTTQEAYDARRCCFYLLIRHLKMSYRTVGNHFNLKGRNVRYSYKKCEEILSVKAYYTHFYTRYESLEQLFVNYLTQ